MPVESLAAEFSVSLFLLVLGMSSTITKAGPAIGHLHHKQKSKEFQFARIKERAFHLFFVGSTCPFGRHARIF